MLSVREVETTGFFILYNRRLSENQSFQIYRDRCKEEQNKLFSAMIAGKAGKKEYKL